jgi:chlorosome envelope protein B
MSNGSNINVQGTVDNIVETAGKLVQLQIDVLNNGLKVVSDVAEPLAKTMTDLIGNLANALSQALQGVANAVSKK